MTHAQPTRDLLQIISEQLRVSSNLLYSDFFFLKFLNKNAHDYDI